MDQYPNLEETRIIHESVRRLIGSMIGDVIAETRRRVDAAKPKSAADVRGLSNALVSFSEEMNGYNIVLKKFLFERMYRHYRVNRSMSKAKRIVADLFTLLHDEPELLPPEWQQGCDGVRGMKSARRVCDFIAGMTDKFAIEEHRRLFDLNDPRA
jgi:dGTPase